MAKQRLTKQGVHQRVSIDQTGFYKKVSTQQCLGSSETVLWVVMTLIFLELARCSTCPQEVHHSMQTYSPQKKERVKTSGLVDVLYASSAQVILLCHFQTPGSFEAIHFVSTGDAEGVTQWQGTRRWSRCGEAPKLVGTKWMPLWTPQVIVKENCFWMLWGQVFKPRM